MEWSGVEWCGVGWMVWSGIVLCGVVCCRVVWGEMRRGANWMVYGTLAPRLRSPPSPSLSHPPLTSLRHHPIPTWKRSALKCLPNSWAYPSSRLPGVQLSTKLAKTSVRISPTSVSTALLASYQSTEMASIAQSTTKETIRKEDNLSLVMLCLLPFGALFTASHITPLPLGRRHVIEPHPTTAGVESGARASHIGCL